MTSSNDGSMDNLPKPAGEAKVRDACREFDRGLSGYLEGEPRGDIERHARECPFCSVVLADLESLRGQCRELPVEEPPANLWANVRQSLEAEGILPDPRAACREFDRGLAAYLEGEPRPQIELHARECAYCSVVLADLELLRADSAALPEEDPPALVWSNVRATLEAEGILTEPPTAFGRMRRLSWAHWAAPASVMAALTIVAGLFVLSPGRLEIVGPAAPPTAGFDVSPEVAMTVGQLEQNYAAQEAKLDPALQATYRKSLDSLDASIKECRETIHSKPSDTLAQEYLLAAYTEKAEVLESALELDGR